MNSYTHEKAAKKKLTHRECIPFPVKTHNMFKKPTDALHADVLSGAFDVYRKYFV